MIKTAILIILFMLPVMAEAHPGKTDRYGGHLCLKGCEEWGLFYKEYHLHDKDWKPIRLGKNRKASEPIMKDVTRSVETGTPNAEAMLPEKPKMEVVTTYRYVTKVYEENVFPVNPFLFILLILLLLLLILRMNRRREEG